MQADQRLMFNTAKDVIDAFEVGILTKDEARNELGLNDEVVTIPKVKPRPKVGDEITGRKADCLPIGSVVRRNQVLVRTELGCWIGDSGYKYGYLHDYDHNGNPFTVIYLPSE
jgi:hypothetical protein